VRNNSWLGILLLLAACGPGEDATVRPIPINRKPIYFDVKGFLDSQVVFLNRRQPIVEKQVRLRDGKVETTCVAKTDWSKELQIFYQMDINKPALRGAYDVKNVNQPAATADLYQRKAGVKAAVRELLVASAINYPATINATVIQDNSLFYSEKKLSLRADAQGIKSYSVEGVQKLVMFDTVRYSVRTRVVR
jgi:hypothetical protein